MAVVTASNLGFEGKGMVNIASHNLLAHPGYVGLIPVLIPVFGQLNRNKLKNFPAGLEGVDKMGFMADVTGGQLADHLGEEAPAFPVFFDDPRINHASLS